jgi:hypothetical protein
MIYNWVDVKENREKIGIQRIQGELNIQDEQGIRDETSEPSEINKFVYMFVHIYT